MKIVAEYPAFEYDGKDIAGLITFINSSWPLNADIKESKVMGQWIFTFEYPNNDEAVIVAPDSIIYKGPYGGFQVMYKDNLKNYPSLTLVP